MLSQVGLFRMMFQCENLIRHVSETKYLELLIILDTMRLMRCVLDEVRMYFGQNPQDFDD